MNKLSSLKQESFRKNELSDDYCHKITGGLDDVSFNPVKGKTDDIDENNITRYSPGDEAAKIHDGKSYRYPNINAMPIYPVGIVFY